ncbi:MAG TPA: transcription antitermination factor NusB [Anaerolineales bacterium]|jgi:N utilization substance protein B|nr:transcription antitermination factor NusB [Anaerolineales bacterium]
MKSRTRARGLALQVLYEVDMANHPPVEVYQSRLEEMPLSEELAEFARQIVFGVLPRIPDLDLMIAKYAPEWPLDQVAVIDLNILRLAFWEFAVQRETPLKVAINEAVELAKLYGSDSAPRFINGVLGSLAEHKDEIRQRVETLESK